MKQKEKKKKEEKKKRKRREEADHRPLPRFRLRASARLNSFATLRGILMPEDFGGFHPWAMAAMRRACLGDEEGISGPS